MIDEKVQSIRKEQVHLREMDYRVGFELRECSSV